MTDDQKMRLIYDLYWCLVNHPPCPDMFENRTRVLSEAYGVVRHLEDRFAIPEET